MGVFCLYTHKKGWDDRTKGLSNVFDIIEINYYICPHMETKVCTKCNEEKCLSEFKKTKEKYSSRCNICISLYFKQYREKNKEKRKKHALNYYIRNKEIVKERSKLRSIKIKDDEIEIEKSRIRRKIYREKNKEIIRIKGKNIKRKTKTFLKKKVRYIVPKIEIK